MAGAPHRREPARAPADASDGASHSEEGHAGAIPSGPDVVADRSRRAWLRWLPLAVVACASLAVLLSGAWHGLSLERLLASRAWLHAAVSEDRARAIAVAAAAYVASVVVSVPASLVLTIVCGFLFGTVTGALVAVGSATTGAAIVFTVGRHAAGDLIRARAGARIGRFADGFRRDAFGYVVFLRLLPIFPFWLTNLAPAAFGVRLGTFLAATFVGLAPGAFLYAGIGAGVEDAAAAHAAAKAACGGEGCMPPLEFGGLVSPRMVAALAALAGFAALSVVLRRWMHTRTRRA